MYTVVNGLERTAANFHEIVTAAGFSIQRVYPTRGTASSMCILTLTLRTWLNMTLLELVDLSYTSSRLNHRAVALALRYVVFLWLLL